MRTLEITPGDLQPGDVIVATIQRGVTTATPRLEVIDIMPGLAGTVLLPSVSLRRPDGTTAEHDFAHNVSGAMVRVERN